MDDFQLDELLSHSYLDVQNDEVQPIATSKIFYYKDQFEEWLMQQEPYDERL